MPTTQAGGTCCLHVKLCCIYLCDAREGLQAGVKHIIITLGPLGAALCTQDAAQTMISIQHLPAAPAAVVSTSGAGDCLVAGCAAALLQDAPPLEALAIGLVCLSLEQSLRLCAAAWLIVARWCSCRTSTAAAPCIQKHDRACFIWSLHLMCACAGCGRARCRVQRKCAA